MNSRDTDAFISFLNQKRAMISGNENASLAFLKEVGIVNENGQIIRKHRISELSDSLNNKANKLIVSKNFSNKKHGARCIPQGRD